MRESAPHGFSSATECSAGNGFPTLVAFSLFGSLLAPGFPPQHDRGSWNVSIVAAPFFSFFILACLVLPWSLNAQRAQQG